MNTFYSLLAISLVVGTTNNFVWFALTYWIYLQTHSVAATGIAGGLYMIAAALSSFIFGSLIDHHRKQKLMFLSSSITLVLLCFASTLYWYADHTFFASITNPLLWLFVCILLGSVIAGNIYSIAVPTLVSFLVPEKLHTKANGLYGSVTGITFTITSVASGLTLGFGGMHWVLLSAVVCTICVLFFLTRISIGEKKIIHTKEHPALHFDVKGTFAVVTSIPGLLALIFFTTFNNFLGGVFMALMDAYGLSLVSVQVWGILWGFLGLGFILGGLLVAKKGLGKKPLRSLFRINIITWTICIFFTIQPSIILLASGILVWITLMPFIEATEQTIIQKVVPKYRQGRVFGFAQSIEQAASPLTALCIGPITQYIFIPFMTTGAGVNLLGSWYGVGAGRGIALVFSLTGIIGLIVTLFAMRSRAYRLLASHYEKI